MQRLKIRGTSLMGSMTDTFERHRVVFTVGTSIASVATAWFGYSLRHYHESKVDQRLESIEKAMKNNHHLEHADFKKLVDTGPSRTAAWVATAGTALIIGYGLGWRGGTWYANRKFRKEQLKLAGQIKPKRWQLLGELKSRGWQLRFPRPPTRFRVPQSALTTSEAAGNRKALYSVEAQDEGICKSMVETQGYECEEHTVTTKDGYILSMQRVPVGRSGGTPGTRPPVLLQHGLLMDAITWLLMPPEQSLAFVLSDNGYDVWLANSRGTKYSRGHTSLSHYDPAYLDWSWDELVAYDLPATIQYVYNQTGQKLHYVGHSQGTLMALAAFSKDEVLSMFRSVALLCPIAYLGQLTSPLAKNAAENFIAESVYWLGLHEFDPRGEAVIKLLKDACSKPGVDCTNLLTSFTGQNCCLNSSIVNTFLDHEPQPSATKNMIHLAQSNYGGEDALADDDDVNLFLGSLNDHDGDKLVVQYRNDYAHADYVMAKNAKQDVYDPLIAFFRLH
ncbi:triacylglycerol lipase 2-like [Hibiscus syriacus]|uniref:Triacylglycerol lipase 2-like n=1 Tax=Hibiscus syriacus TaxID=106335 RepID=A0A6A2Z491_HIBSY|nr:triacylglycerol lipase 2-like [Hibiscus syriacus]